MNKNFELFLELRKISNLSKSEDKTIMKYMISINRKDYRKFKSLIEAGILIFDTDIESEISDEKKSFSVIIKKKDFKKKTGFTFYETIDDFLNDNIIWLETDFYIHDKKYFSSNKSSEIYKKFHNYLKLKEVFDLLKDDYKLKEYLFVKNHNTKINVKLTKGFLLNKSENFNVFINNFSNTRSVYNNDYKLIVKNNIISFICQKNNTDFSVFINYFEEFFEYVTRDYRIFINKFTFDSVHKEFIKEKDDFLKGINSQIKHLQSQLIGLPIAFLITFISQIITQIPQLFKITFLCLFFIYLVIQIILVSSNLSETKYLKSKIKKKEENYNIKKVASYFTDDFINLYNKIKYIRSIILFIFIFIFGLLVISISFIIFNLPILDAEKTIYNFIKIIL